MAERSALIVATSSYADERLRRLRAPAKDADALAAVLADPAIGDFAVDEVRDGMHAVLTRAISRFFKERGLDDLLLLHLSCHGIRDEGGELYFATQDTDLDDLEATAIAASWLTRLMQRSMSKRIVVTLDCCHAGAISRGMLARGGASAGTADLMGRGRVIMTASDALEYALEDGELTGEGSPSIFTSAVVEGLATGAADRDGDGWVSVDELYDHVYEAVRARTPHMTPLLSAPEQEGQFLLARNPHGPAAAKLDAELLRELADDRSWRRGGAVMRLGELLHGADLPLAKAARAELERVAAHDDSRSVAAAAQQLLLADGVVAPPGAPVGVPPVAVPEPEPETAAPEATTPDAAAPEEPAPAASALDEPEPAEPAHEDADREDADREAAVLEAAVLEAAAAEPEPEPQAEPERDAVAALAFAAAPEPVLDPPPTTTPEAESERRADAPVPLVSLSRARWRERLVTRERRLLHATWILAVASGLGMLLPNTDAGPSSEYELALSLRHVGGLGYHGAYDTRVALAFAFETVALPIVMVFIATLGLTRRLRGVTTFGALLALTVIQLAGWSGFGRYLSQHGIAHDVGTSAGLVLSLLLVGVAIAGVVISRRAAEATGGEDPAAARRAALVGGTAGILAFASFWIGGTAAALAELGSLQLQADGVTACLLAMGAAIALARPLGSRNRGLALGVLLGAALDVTFFFAGSLAGRAQFYGLPLGAVIGLLVGVAALVTVARAVRCPARVVLGGAGEHELDAATASAAEG